MAVSNASGLATNLVSGGHAGSVPWLSTPFVVPAGTITWTTGASDAGDMAWYLTYIPLDDGASVS